VKIPIPVIAIVADVISNRFTHSRIENFADAAGIINARGEFLGNKLDVVRFWMKCANDDAEPLAKLGVFITELMEVDYDGFRLEEAQASLEKDRTRVRESLAKHGLAYLKDGKIVVIGVQAVSKTVESFIKTRDLSGVHAEFDRITANVEADPPAAVTASCALLESLFKAYISEERLQMPSDKSLGPLWKVVRNHLTLEPDKLQEDDIRKVLTGLGAVVDGIGALRTHEGSAHGREKRNYKIKPRQTCIACSVHDCSVHYGKMERPLAKA